MRTVPDSPLEASRTRRRLAGVIALAAVLALLPGGDAGAARKKMQGSFEATALPYPMHSTTSTPPQKDSCTRQIATADSFHSLEAPRRGNLTVTMSDFAGDWDLFILDQSHDLVVASVQDQLRDSAPAHEEILLGLARGQDVHIVPCNWLGEPQVTVKWTFEYSTASKKGRR